MKKRAIVVMLVLAFAVVAVIAGLLHHQYKLKQRKAIFRAILFNPGGTMEQTAHILVHDSKFGMRARDKAVQHGDAILPLIRKESENFTALDSRNAFWIAEVLGSIKTDRSRKVLMDLYSRTNTLARLTGAVGLARHGALPDPINEDSFLVRNVRANPGQTETHLSIIALGWTRDERAIPCLLELLKKRHIGYWRHAHACEALARLGSRDAIPALRDCLTSEDFHALPSAFRALIALGDREAVPLAIARVTPELKDKNSGFVVRELEKVTGESYAYKQGKWKKWWDAVEGKWQIPERFTKPWDEQEEVH